MFQLGNDWDNVIGNEFGSDYYLSLREFLKVEYQTKKIYPKMDDIYNALRYTSYKDTKVVILGQDPYHGEGQAHGLCFSVKQGVMPPPSLKNIFKDPDTYLSLPMRAATDQGEEGRGFLLCAWRGQLCFA